MMVLSVLFEIGMILLDRALLFVLVCVTTCLLSPLLVLPVDAQERTQATSRQEPAETVENLKSELAGLLDASPRLLAARNAARVGSVTPAGACGTATSELIGNDVGTVTCELLENCATGTIRVRLTAQQTVSLPLVGDRNVTLHASSSYACPR